VRLPEHRLGLAQGLAELDPVNWWTGTLILALALDVNRPPIKPRRGR
jgi:hypothetical protein